MRRLLPLLAFLMLVLAGWTGMAHAADLAGGSIGGVELVVHTPGDHDEVAADADKGVPHHHNVCHGHDVGDPAQPTAIHRVRDLGARPVVGPAILLTGTIGPVLPRPPRA